mmetsp:Transcript_52019/g.121913  ORF Transcript_52019/g.121913 Transcript_52019/m.121913 type:complete len:88 (+) Transcript_52019:159-422(+)
MVLVGGRWDVRQMRLGEGLAEQLASPLPVMHLRPAVSSPSTAGVYTCPLFQSSRVAPEFIINLSLPTTLPEHHWILRGTAAFCQTWD